MKLQKIFVLTLAITVMAVGSGFAQELTGLPAQPSFEGVYYKPTSTEINPLIITTQDISWDGTGSVDFKVNLNQRARVWVAVYRTGSTETGERGPFGAWLRLQPQDLYVWSNGVSTGADLESGNNTITWDGNDFEGNAAGPGSYEFDIIGWNVLDPSSLAGVMGRGFGDNIIDVRYDPPEVWSQEYDRDAPQYGGHKMGDIMHSNLGDDFISNPNAWERWDYNSVVDFEGAQTLSGMRADPEDTEKFFTSNRSGEQAGIYKMTINRAAKAWDADTDWADNGFAAVADPQIRMYQMEIYNDMIINPNWSTADVPASSIEVFDKNSGEVTQQFDISEWFTNVGVDDEGNETLSAGGPGNLSADPSGIWTSGWASSNLIKIDWNGDIIWVNRAGDMVGDRVTYEQAAETGMTPESSYPIRFNSDINGKSAIFSPRHNSLGNVYSGLGRDGTGLYHIFVDAATVVPKNTGSGTYICMIQNDGYRTGGTPLRGANYGSRGKWDGLYTESEVELITLEPGQATETKFGPKAMFFLPYDSVSGTLGAGVTAVEEVESAGTPDSYSLSDAYPNPFNPETTIEFSVPSDGYVKVDVYNTAGQLVSSLVDKDLSAGAYKTTWDATQDGQQASSGVYFYRMEAGDFTDTRSMTLLK
jgi:hypothetical protein